jgi:hypothetical protein
MNLQTALGYAALPTSLKRALHYELGVIISLFLPQMFSNSSMRLNSHALCNRLTQGSVRHGNAGLLGLARFGRVNGSRLLHRFKRSHLQNTLVAGFFKDFHAIQHSGDSIIP